MESKIAATQGRKGELNAGEAAEGSHTDVLIERYVKDDSLVKEVKNMIKESSGKRDALRDDQVELQVQVDDLHSIHEDFTRTLKDIAHNKELLWGRVDELSYDLQVMERKKGSDFEKLQLGIQQELRDKQALAKGTEGEYTSKVQEIARMEAQMDKYARQDEKLQAHMKKLDGRLALLRTVHLDRRNRVRDIFTKTVENDVYDVCKDTEKALRALEHATVVNVSASGKQMRRMARQLGHHPRLDNIIDVTNRRIEHIVTETEKTFAARLKEDGAKADLARFCLAAVQDVADTRRELSKYIDALLHETSARLNEVAIEDAKGGGGWGGGGGAGGGKGGGGKGGRR